MRGTILYDPVARRLLARGHPGEAVIFGCKKRFFPRPVALMGLGAACISHSSLTFSRAQARSVIPLSPGLLTGTSAVSVSTAIQPSHGHKRGQRRERNFHSAPAFLRAQARSVIPLSPGLLAGPSAVSNSTVPRPSHGPKRGQRRERM